MKRKNKSILLFICIVLILTFTACGSKASTRLDKSMPKSELKSESKNSKSEANLNNSVKDSKKDAEKTKDSLQLNDRKLIKTADIDLETKEFDNTINSIMDKVNQYGGYVQNSNISGTTLENKNKYSSRSAELTLRISKANFDKFLFEVGDLGNITRKTVNGQDVTNEYFDTEAHLKALIIQEERLLELLKKTGELKDIIEIEKELANVRYKIENLTGTLKKFDNLIDYSTITVNAREVCEFKEVADTPITLWQKTLSAFKSSAKVIVKFFKGLVIFIGSIIPYLIILVVIHLFLKYVFKINLLLKLKNKIKNKN